MSRTLRTRALTTAFTIATAAIPVLADPLPGDEVCWANADTEVVQCFVDEAAFEDAVREQTGTVLIEADFGTASRSNAAVLATYTLARFYEDANYAGSMVAVTSTNSAICRAGTGTSANFSTAWNDRVSSFRSYLSCSTRIFEDSNQGGSWFGYSVNAAGVGVLNDQASSYRVK